VTPTVPPDDERLDKLIAKGWHPGRDDSRRWSMNVCLECGGLTADLDGREPHPAWPACSCAIEEPEK
jgi:hypothetical protein